MPAPSHAVLAVLGAGVLDPATPIARADDAGLTRGDGCFEGCRVEVDGAGHATVAKLDRHLARMGRSAAALDIPFDVDAWRPLIAEAMAAWAATGQGEAALSCCSAGAGPAPANPPAWCGSPPCRPTTRSCAGADCR